MKVIPRHVRPWYLITLIAMIGWGLLTVLVPLTSGTFINRVLADHSQLLGPALWLFLAASGAEIVFSTLGTFLGQDLVRRSQNAFRQRILRWLMGAARYSDGAVAAATTDLNVNSHEVADSYVKGEVDIVNCMILIAASAAGLLSINLLLSAVILAVSVLIVLFPKVLEKPSQANRAEKAAAQDQLNRRVTSFTAGIETLASFGAGRYFLRRLEADNRAIVKTEGRANGYITLTYAVNAFLQVAKTFAIIGLGAFLITRGQLSVGGMLAAIQIAANLGAPMEVLSWLLYTRREITPIATRLTTQYQAAPSEVPADDPVADIRLKDFSLASADKPLLTGVTLDFEAGRKYLVVGPSGAGKSTLLRAIAGSGGGTASGALLINGADSRAFSRIKLVTQTPAVFNVGLADNLFMGQPVDAERLDATLSLLELQPLVARLGLDAPLSDSALSGGEKQRIALGRALLARPDVLLLDEFNSALDHDLGRRLEAYVLRQPFMVISILHHLDETLLPEYDALIRVTDGRVTAVEPLK
ncbi:ATP-binding cassette domain-containing protein [Lacticaseibacillus kribbianus]|uniref:ATP-binding cassette domain-containing protein n=1 Tax=Lacticaseibacillus kribbianus TaxID=2926292 RepID=UPI001CD5892B|nr:ABC transporter ATP-binding protein [Lacticaseibacillus kribbianus]